MLGRCCPNCYCHLVPLQSETAKPCHLLFPRQVVFLLLVPLPVYSLHICGLFLFLYLRAGSEGKEEGHGKCLCIKDYGQEIYYEGE